jgi:hypothetical protein
LKLEEASRARLDVGSGVMRPAQGFLEKMPMELPELWPFEIAVFAGQTANIRGGPHRAKGPKA